jgi:hypothetical protein
MLLDADEQPVEARMRIANMLVSWTLLVVLVLSFAAFAVFVFQTYSPWETHRVQTAINLARTAGGGEVSPALGALCLFAALYVPCVWSLRRLSLIGKSYTSLERSYAFRLFAGPAESADVTQFEAGCADEEVQELVGMLDMPLQNLPAPYLLAIAIIVIVGGLSLTSQGTTLDGRFFSWFMFSGTATAIALGLMLLAQSGETWRLLHQKLSRLQYGPLMPAFGRVGKIPLRWSFWLTPPAVCELLPAAKLIDDLRGWTRALAWRSTDDSGAPWTDDRRAVPVESLAGRLLRHKRLMRASDLTVALRSLDSSVSITELDPTCGRSKSATLLQNKDWFELWKLADALALCLQHTAWVRRPHEDHAPWFKQAETVIALQFALMIRDVLARIMSGVLAAMLCLTFVAAAHLFYTFQGRSAFLTIDLLAIGGAALVAMWTLTGMERDRVLSVLRRRPGGINWEFIKRIGLYGVLPLLTVVGSLFPEVGDFLFGWLEPLRKLATF